MIFYIIRKRWEFGNSASSDLTGKTTQGNLFPRKIWVKNYRSNHLYDELPDSIYAQFLVLAVRMLGWCSESVETSLNETPKFKAIDK